MPYGRRSMLVCEVCRKLYASYRADSRTCGSAHRKALSRAIAEARRTHVGLDKILSKMRSRQLGREHGP